MADFVFNVSKGRIREFADRVENNDPANSALIIVPIVANGVSDATMIDIDDLATLLATAVNEATGTGWNRKTLTDAATITRTVNDTDDRFELDIDDQVWTSVADAADTVTDLLVCYDSDTTGGTDSNIIPIACLDFAVDPTGGNITATIDATGVMRAA